MLKNFIPKEDGLMVQRMKAAGCIVIGKTNVPEFGLGSHSFNEVFGATRNAYDLSKTAGGSSGGAAVALATEMLSVADGSDFMGSLAQPGSMGQCVWHAAIPGPRSDVASQRCVDCAIRD